MACSAFYLCMNRLRLEVGQAEEGPYTEKNQSHKSHSGHQRKAGKTDRQTQGKLGTGRLGSCAEKPQHPVSSVWLSVELNTEAGLLQTADQGVRVFTIRKEKAETVADPGDKFTESPQEQLCSAEVSNRS